MINNQIFINSLIPVNNNASISILLGIQSRNTILKTIKTMLDNLQNLLVNYNNAFTFQIQAITNKLNNNNPSMQCTIFESISKDIQTCLMLQDKMWKDIIIQKNTADSQLFAVQQNIINLQKSNTILPNIIQMKVPQISPNPQFIRVNALHNTYNNSQIFSSVHSHKPVSKRSLDHSITQSNGNSSKIKTPDTVKSDKRRRKRRGYNGPYSEEEKKFMINYNTNNKCETTDDIVKLSNYMEKKFKVKRSPYGLCQKMYQMNIINSRLKSLFQRKFANESKHTTSDFTNESIDSNDITLCVKRRTFMAEESNYINELIANYEIEKPKKLFWRFCQRFTEWKNDNKSYQKFYHKYWTLTNNKYIVDNVSNNNDEIQRKRLSTVNVNQPCKRIKLS